MPLFKILLIDANPSFRTTFSSLLRRSGYQVAVADSLPSGLEQFDREETDLVLLGIDIAETASTDLSQSFANCTTILLLSGAEGRSDASPQKGRIKNHLVFYKPFRTEEVLAAIYAALIARTASV